MKKFIAAFVLFTLLSSNAFAALIFEDFSSGLNGWGHIQTSDGTSTGGSLGTGDPKSIVATGGPSGTGDSYLQYQDVNASFMHAIFGNGWSGNLSAYNNGTLSFDYIQTAPSTGSAFIGSFGFLRISGGGLTFGSDVISGNPSTAWQNQTLVFNAASFGATTSQWNTVLLNVTEIRLNVESWSGIQEFVGLDNVSLEAARVNSPSMAWLLSLCVYIILLTAKKRK